MTTDYTLFAELASTTSQTMLLPPHKEEVVVKIAVEIVAESFFIPTGIAMGVNFSHLPLYLTKLPSFFYHLPCHFWLLHLRQVNS